MKKHGVRTVLENVNGRQQKTIISESSSLKWKQTTSRGYSKAFRLVSNSIKEIPTLAAILNPVNETQPETSIYCLWSRTKSQRIFREYLDLCASGRLELFQTAWHRWREIVLIAITIRSVCSIRKNGLFDSDWKSCLVIKWRNWVEIRGVIFGLAVCHNPIW